MKYEDNQENITQEDFQHSRNMEAANNLTSKLKWASGIQKKKMEDKINFVGIYSDENLSSEDRQRISFASWLRFR